MNNCGVYVMEMSQLIIARKDLEMSSGKLAAQVSHASMAFLTNMLRSNVCDISGIDDTVVAIAQFDKDTWSGWINGSFTKIVCEAKNKHHLLRVLELASELGLKENVDYFLIRDNCYTELQPEEFDDKGVGRTLTCIGFRPLPKDVCRQLSRKYQLYR